MATFAINNTEDLIKLEVIKFYIYIDLLKSYMANKVDAKVVLLGKEYSGKTCLVERYLHGRFNKDIPYQNVSRFRFKKPGFMSLYKHLFNPYSQCV